MEVFSVSMVAALRKDSGDALGVNVSAIAMDDATATIERWIAEGRREYACIIGVHGIMECRRDLALHKIHNKIHNEAGMVTPDGVPLVYFLRLTGKKHRQRVYGPDLMRKPKQQRWMAVHLGRLDAPVMIGVGAAFDFLAGTKRQAPKWMQRHALEWLFRLCSEPRRLWRRHAYSVPGFSFLATVELLRRALRGPGSAGEALSREYQ